MKFQKEKEEEEEEEEEEDGVIKKKTTYICNLTWSTWELGTNSSFCVGFIQL